MEITQSYSSLSSASPRGDGLGFSLQTEAARPGVRLEALVRHSRSYGRVMLALHRVVSQEARFVERDHSAYQQWVRGQYLQELAPLAGKLPALQSELAGVRAQLEPLDARASELYGDLQHLARAGASDYYQAQRRFWKYLYTRDHALWVVLDPVVSVHPDATLFEVFSRDESSYACVRVPLDNLETLGSVSYGTTNVDYSQALADEMARVRDYRGAFLSVGQGGVSVQTSAGTRVEKKIDLPPSWVRGFLQVQSASALSQVSLCLSATTVAEVLRRLQARREKEGPRSLAFHLVPGQCPAIEIQPWGEVVKEARFVWNGSTGQTVRIWGRRRLMVLDELLPHAQSVEVRLLGDGLPSFWALELEGHRFELGLSGWTENDWSASARFDALASGSEVSGSSLDIAAKELEFKRILSPSQLASIASWERAEATATLQKLCREGRAMFDSKIDAYRWRQLLSFPAPDSPEDAKARSARRWVASGQVEVETVPQSEVEANEFLERYNAPGMTFSRAEFVSKGGTFRPLFARDLDGRVRFWQCTCGEFRRDKGRSGPCAHLLAALGQLEVAKGGAS